MGIGLARCILCGAVRVPAHQCDPKAVLALLATAFRANPQAADLAEASALLRWNAAKGA